MTISTDLCYKNGRGGANTKKKKFVLKENKNSCLHILNPQKGLLALAENDTIGWQKKHTRLAN